MMLLVLMIAASGDAVVYTIDSQQEDSRLEPLPAIDWQPTQGVPRLSLNMHTHIWEKFKLVNRPISMFVGGKSTQGEHIKPRIEVQDRTRNPGDKG